MTVVNDRTQADGVRLVVGEQMIQLPQLVRVTEPARAIERGPGRPTAIVKRIIDLLIAALLLLLLVPVFALMMLAIHGDSRGPAIYRQTRVGRHGVTFRCWKFRTMILDADRQLEDVLASDPAARREFELTRKLIRDPRVTRVGALMRSTSLDELPQLWNVLRGDMSLVGPRPVVPDELVMYGSAVDIVLRVRPGITGAWQVSGRNDLTYAQRVALDRDYAVHHTSIGDVRILVSTVRVVLSRRGAY